MTTELDRTFEALSDPTRLAVVELLGKKPRRSSEIAAALALSRPATSRHLGVLRRAGIVTETSLQDDARARVYRLCPEPFSELERWLRRVEGFWGDQLESFKTHVERRQARRRK